MATVRSTVEAYVGGERRTEVVGFGHLWLHGG
jgi:hypothetical protein